MMVNRPILLTEHFQFHIINVQRRMGDWYFETAKSWEDLVAAYSVEWQPDEKHLLRVGNPRLYEHPYQSSQLELWPPQAVEWFVILQAIPYGPRPRRKRATRILVMQPPLLAEDA
jgi:hypothetical protein